MLRKKITLSLIILIVCIILFDALQQQYYLETFDLTPYDISLTNLIKNHFVRWMMWVIVSIPFSLIVNKTLIHDKEKSTYLVWVWILLMVITSTILSVFMVTLESMIVENTSFNFAEFNHVFIFFIYQKGLAFCFAFFTLTLALFNQSKGIIIQEQSVVIENLEKNRVDLKEALKSSMETEPHLNVKTGYKMKPIPLSEIVWIQSDDYCVKIHTVEKSFTLRQSLKNLEEKLSHHQFIRVHRGALLNIQFLDHINYDASTLKLTNETQLPLSKTGMQTLKNYLQKSAI